MIPARKEPPTTMAQYPMSLSDAAVAWEKALSRSTRMSARNPWQSAVKRNTKKVGANHNSMRDADLGNSAQGVAGHEGET